MVLGGIEFVSIKPDVEPNGEPAIPGIDEEADLLEVFQIYAKPSPHAEPVYTSVIMEHTFGFSYGKPFVGIYKPAPVNFTHVHLTLSATSAGRQFDRLALVFIGDHEVWRTSTAEPTYNGIIFEYRKDVTKFLSVLQSEQKFIFEMGNLVDDIYTGQFCMTLKAEFFNVAKKSDSADLIIPLSAKKSNFNKPSHWSLPTDRASVAVKLPRKSRKVIALISASGNADEEFWYTNVASKYKNAFSGTYLPGHGPHREVQVYVNEKLAGAVFPFQVIYTGGFSPALWRPVVGVAAYDVPMYEIDLTPFLPELWEGANVDIRVSSGDETESGIYSDWIVSGNIFAWSGTEDGHGEIKEYFASPLLIETNGTQSLDRTALNVSSKATREIRINSILTFGSVSKEHISYSFSNSTNHQYYSNEGESQRVDAFIERREDSTNLGQREFFYPINLDSTYQFTPVFKVSADISREVSIVDHVENFKLWTHQSGSAYYIGQDTNGNGPYGGGSTNQGYTEEKLNEMYWRSVRAVNGRVIRDLEIKTPGDEDLATVKALTYGELDSLAGSKSNEELTATAKFPYENELLTGCLQNINAKLLEGVISTSNAADNADVKACIRSLFGRGPK
ncbi:peptide N-acetyl-beta-D-glucosaminyl asparaginase amidase A-domain-containing protein [Lipomyces japonicus]|uniref:peptide N-acetyl-beta-D-glucosaminyl asparaginase amidase A-domain-containing protein n=1 Tax=Lipomyces japonicus TaxID=56871 RepID=UPI0034CF575F